MLPRKRRIRTKEFHRTAKKSRVFSSDYFTLRVHKKNESELSTFAFVVSGKVAKTAVKRNRLRRRGYHAIQDLVPKTHHGVSCIFYAKKESVALPYQSLKKDISLLLKKAGVIKK